MVPPAHTWSYIAKCLSVCTLICNSHVSVSVVLVLIVVWLAFVV